MLLKLVARDLLFLFLYLQELINIMLKVTIICLITDHLMIRKSLSGEKKIGIFHVTDRLVM